MKRFITAFVFLLGTVLLHAPSTIEAQTITFDPKSLTTQDTGIKITISGLKTDKTYSGSISGPEKTRGPFDRTKPDGSGTIVINKLCGNLEVKTSCNEPFFEGRYGVSILEDRIIGSFRVAQSTFNVLPKIQGEIEFLNTSFTVNDDITIKAKGLPDGDYNVLVDGKNPSTGEKCRNTKNGWFEVNLGKYFEGNHTVQVFKNRMGILCGKGSFITQRVFTISSSGGGAGPGVPPGTIVGPGGGGGGAGGGGTGGPPTTCSSGMQGIDTALGCIPTENITEFIKWFLSWAIGIAGGIAFLLILSSGFQIMTSSGNPDKLKGGQEQLTAAVSGLMFIIFAVFLLRLIGVEILQIPGF